MESAVVSLIYRVLDQYAREEYLVFWCDSVQSGKDLLHILGQGNE
jgi:hypothetical protein